MILKPTGIVRKLDDLGRVCIPKELRNTLDLPEGTAIEIFVAEEGVFLKPYTGGYEQQNRQYCPECGKRMQEYVGPEGPIWKCHHCGAKYKMIKATDENKSKRRQAI